MITPIGLQFSPRCKKSGKCCSNPTFGINPGELPKEGERTIKDAATELGSVIIRKVKKKVLQIKEESTPIIKGFVKRKIKGLMEKTSQKLKKGSEKIKLDE